MFKESDLFEGSSDGGDEAQSLSTGTFNFRRWFGASKVVDDQGRPLVVYHGTGADLEQFNTQGGRGKTHETGAFFSSNPATASTYTGGASGGNVLPVFLNLENPVVIDAQGKNWNAIQQKAKVQLPAVTVNDQADEDLLAALTGRAPVRGVVKHLRARSTNVRSLFAGEWDYPDDTASTDDLARWVRKQGYDGLVIRNVCDNGPTGSFASEESRAPSDLYVAFRPNQIKSAVGNNGDYDASNPGIRFSMPRQSQADPFKVWCKGSPLLRIGERVTFRAGQAVVVEAVHGTTADFTAFDRSKASVEGNLGAGFYFSNNVQDASGNYAGFGPDLTAKIERAKDWERCGLEEDPDFSERPYEEVEAELTRRAHARYVSHDGVVMPVYVRFDNPLVLGGDGETFLDYQCAIEDEPSSGTLADLLVQLELIAGDNEFEMDLRAAVSAVEEAAFEEDGLMASEAIELIKKALVYAVHHETGDAANAEIVRRAIEGLGFDGIIDQTVSRKFGVDAKSQKPMDHVSRDTVHYIAFSPTQIKSSLGNSGDYDPQNPDIRFSFAAPAGIEEQVDDAQPQRERQRG